MPQFVLLFHECPSAIPRASHWDLMFQVGQVLRTWVLYELPQEWADGTAHAPPAGTAGGGAEVAAEEIQAHRLEYLTLEGRLSGDRGSVRQIDHGRYEPAAISDCRIQVRLYGERIGGVLELTRPDANTPFWRLNLPSPTRKAE